MKLIHEPEFVAAGHFWALLEDAWRQNFTKDDPHDGGINRHGMRPNTMACFEWAGFEYFIRNGYDRLKMLAADLDDRVTMSMCHVELTLMQWGSEFGVHVDMPYHNQTAPVVSFVYYLQTPGRDQGGEWFTPDGIEIKPVPNTLLMYRGTSPHGVRGVLSDRLTINGYFSV